MRRRLFTILSALSLLICVGVAALWVRSHFVADFWEIRHAKREDRIGYCKYWFGYDCGVLVYWRGEFDEGSYLFSDPSEWRHFPTAPTGLSFDGFPFSYTNQRTGPYGVLSNRTRLARSKEIRVHLWLICAVLLLIPSGRFLTRQGRLPGLCRYCGYDLRATPERCPECGRVPNPSKVGSA